MQLAPYDHTHPTKALRERRGDWNLDPYRRGRVPLRRWIYKSMRMGVDDIILLSSACIRGSVLLAKEVMSWLCLLGLAL